MKPKVAVLSGCGLNCEIETMAVFEMAGGSSDRIHVNRLVSGEVKLADYHIKVRPGTNVAVLNMMLYFIINSKLTPYNFC